MTEPQFTKGPWQIKIAKTFYGEGFIGIYDAQGRHTASAYSHMNNANLIAAAPDMYEALEEVVALVCDSCLEYERFKELCYGRQKVVIAENPCNNCTNKVIKALRKARGETE